MRISDWSSDVCSSDLRDDARGHGRTEAERVADRDDPVADARRDAVGEFHEGHAGRIDLEQREVRRGIAADDQIGRANGGTPVTNAQTVCPPPPEKKNTSTQL